MKVTTSDRLKEIMAARELRQVDIINKCQPFCQKFNAKLQKNDLSQYISGKVLPSQYKLTILALALGVTEAWLMGYDVPMERPKEEKSPTSGSDRVAELSAVLASLPPEALDKAADYISMLSKIYG